MKYNVNKECFVYNIKQLYEGDMVFLKCEDIYTCTVACGRQVTLVETCLDN